MYVLCAGMYRACSTWQYEVIAHLLERHRGGQRLGYMTGEGFAELRKRNRGDGGWYVLKSHEGHRQFARSIGQGHAIAIYAHRDLRDVVFSMMHKRGVSFEQFLRQGMIHQVLANDRFWSAQPNLLTQRYEDLIAAPAIGVREIAGHLGIETNEREAAEIAAEYSFQTNRQRTQVLVQRLQSEGIDLNDPANLQYYDQRTLLHWNHLREGRPGTWRELANPAQREILARLCDPWLRAHGYEADTAVARRARQTAGAWLRRERDLVQAWAACVLRCASLRYPLCARWVKRALGISPALPTAVPAAIPSDAAPDARPDTGAHRIVPEPFLLKKDPTVSSARHGA